MNAGLLDRRITLQRLDTQTDAAGQALEKYVDVATVWAQVTPIRGGESWASAQRLAESTHRFRIRWRRELTPLHRVIYEGAAFDVVEVLEYGRREALDVLASSGPKDRIEGS